MKLLVIPFKMDFKELSLYWHLLCKRFFIKPFLLEKDTKLDISLAVRTSSYEMKKI